MWKNRTTLRDYMRTIFFLTWVILKCTMWKVQLLLMTKLGFAFKSTFYVKMLNVIFYEKYHHHLWQCSPEEWVKTLLSDYYYQKHGFVTYNRYWLPHRFWIMHIHVTSLEWLYLTSWQCVYSWGKAKLWLSKAWICDI